MKKNRIEKKSGLGGVMTLISFILVAAIVVGVFIAYEKLRKLWLE